MRPNIKSIGGKEGLMLILPALAFGLWGFIASRPKPPIPFDKPHIQEEVISQITKRLEGHSWQGGGEQLTFKKVDAVPAKETRLKDSFVLRPDTIVILLDIDCEAKIPTQIAPFHSHSIVELKLTKQKPDSLFAGNLRVPGYGIIRISFPVTTPKSS